MDERQGPSVSRTRFAFTPEQLMDRVNAAWSTYQNLDVSRRKLVGDTFKLGVKAAGVLIGLSGAENTGAAEAEAKNEQRHFGEFSTIILQGLREKQAAMFELFDVPGTYNDIEVPTLDVENLIPEAIATAYAHRNTLKEKLTAIFELYKARGVSFIDSHNLPNVLFAYVLAGGPGQGDKQDLGEQPEFLVTKVIDTLLNDPFFNSILPIDQVQKMAQSARIPLPVDLQDRLAKAQIAGAGVKILVPDVFSVPL